MRYDADRIRQILAYCETDVLHEVLFELRLLYANIRNRTLICVARSRTVLHNGKKLSLKAQKDIVGCFLFLRVFGGEERSGGDGGNKLTFVGSTMKLRPIFAQ